MLPIAFAANIVNHSDPSAPLVIPCGVLDATVTVYSVITPAVVMRPILLSRVSVNQSAPSGPMVIPCGTHARGA